MCVNLRLWHTHEHVCAHMYAWNIIFNAEPNLDLIVSPLLWQIFQDFNVLFTVYVTIVVIVKPGRNRPQPGGSPGWSSMVLLKYCQTHQIVKICYESQGRCRCSARPLQCNESIFPYNHIEDDEDFVLCLSDHWRVTVGSDIKELKENFYNPFEVNSGKSILPMFDCDPDFHYYNLMCSSLSSCDYFLEDSFNARCEDLSLTSDCFSLFHSNIRSIPKNLYDLELFLSGLRIKFTVMAFSETWLNSTNHLLYNIEGYNVESAYRSCRRGGGVSLYITPTTYCVCSSYWPWYFRWYYGE